MPDSAAARRIVLSPAARTDIREALQWGREWFGERAVGRYRVPLKQAFGTLRWIRSLRDREPGLNLSKGFALIILFSAADGREVSGSRRRAISWSIGRGTMR
ncbi:MAG: hypothetical protein ACKV2U_23725 [Bryobacteraceae bacterium]